MKFDLVRPCGDCPFRTDLPPGPYISAGRVREILGGGKGRAWWPATWFACHKTVDYKRAYSGRITNDTQHCAGVMIILRREDRQNDAMQLAERLGYWNPAKLDMTAPVYFDTAEAIAAHNAAEDGDGRRD